MKDRYKQKFAQLKERKEKALIPFVVAGDPDYNTSLQIVKTIIDSGADILELGFAFSEPIADGPTIHAAGQRALKAGADTDKNFEFVRKIRKYDKHIPIGILIYSNLIYQRSIAKFYKDAKAAGIDSVLVADLPIEEAGEYINHAKKNKVSTVFIVSQLTSDERMKRIAGKTDGFVYVVSRLGVTGARKELGKGTLSLIKRIRPKTSLPICVGFGISAPEQVRSVTKEGADGAIVGSAIVKMIEKNIKNHAELLKSLKDYIKALKKATFR